MFDALFGSNRPSDPTAPLDSTTQGLISDQVTRANDPNLGQKVNSGVAASGAGQLQTAGQANQEAAGTGSNPAMLQAIRNQYNGIAGKQIQGIVNQNNFNLPGIRNQMQTQASAEANAMQSISNQQQQIMVQANNNWSMARASALAGVLGSIGGPIGQSMGKSFNSQSSKKPMSQDQFNNLGPSGGEDYSDAGEMDNSASIDAVNTG